MQNTKLEAKNAALEHNLSMTMERTEKFEKMSEAQMQTAAADIEPAAGDVSNGMLIPGTDTRVKLGGYVKIDAIHDFEVSRDGNGEDFGLYAAIPLDGSSEREQGGNTRIHARHTRVNLTTTTPTDYADLKVFLEGDFMDSQGSQTTTNRASFGLRHAYGELGPVLVGQTWTNYMDLAAYPESLDFVGVAGNTLVRQGQIRYTHTPEGSGNSYSVSIENASSDYIDATGSTLDSSVEKFPDVTAKARFTGDFGEFSVKGVGRVLEVYNGATTSSDDEFGYALAASGKLNTWGKDDLRFQVGYGDGIGRYLFDLAANAQSAGWTGTTGNVETVEAVGGYLAYRHWWNDDLRTNVMAGGTKVLDNPDFLDPATTNEKVYSANANLIWSITDKFDVGAEYIYGHRETESGAEGDLHRAQMSAIYKF